MIASLATAVEMLSTNQAYILDAIRLTHILHHSKMDKNENHIAWSSCNRAQKSVEFLAPAYEESADVTDAVQMLQFICGSTKYFHPQ